MPNRLSYSQIEKWSYCQKAWEYHYKKRIRSTSIPSPLIFGGAIGKTFEYVLNHIEPQTTPVNLEEAKRYFDTNWTEQEINNVLTSLKDNVNITWLKSDHDKELGDTPWLSMQTKGHLIIESFFNNFLPLVEKVHSTEEEVILTSGEDVNVGYADVVVSLKGYDRPIIMDFKTAGRPYERDSVKDSVQLSQYLYILSDKYNTDLAGYVVFSKQIKKNRVKICKQCGHNGSGERFKTCSNKIELPKVGSYVRCNGEWTETLSPECTMQLIVDQIPLDKQEEVVDNIGVVNDAINTGIITPNWDACDNDFGRSCIYKDLCHNNKMDNLIILEEKKK
jgi:hypothetical protein